MAPIPRTSIESEFSQGKPCPICGEDTLTVVHLESLPDYISCSECEAAFVVEQEGERVLYGKIPDTYPDTQHFALKQWAWLEAIENRAMKERPEVDVAPLEQPPIEDQEPILDDLDEEIETPETPVIVEPPSTPPAEELIESAGIPLDVDEAETEEPQPVEDLGDGVPAWLRTPTSPPSIPLEVPEPPQPMMLEEEPSDLLAEEGRTEDEEERRRSQDLLDELALEGVPDAVEEETVEPPSPQLDTPPFFSEDSVEEDFENEELESFDGLTEEPDVSPEELADSEGIVEELEEIPPSPQEKIKQEEIESLPEKPQDGVIEPAPGSRARVVLRGTLADFLENTCVHCMRSPARQKMVVIAAEGTTPETQSVHTLTICNSCHQRARAKSDDEKNARLMAILTSILISLAAVVVALTLGWVTFEQSLVIDSMILAILAIVGFTIPAWLLLTRSSGFPPPPDAKYVRSTLLSQVAEGGVETMYDWRNQAYAKRFAESNYQNVLGDVSIIEDPIPTVTDQQSETVEPQEEK